MGNAHSSLPHDPLESAVTHPIAPSVANEIDKVIESFLVSGPGRTRFGKSRKRTLKESKANGGSWRSFS